MSARPNGDGDAANPYLLLSLTMVLWGSGFASSKAMVGQMPHSVAAVLRFGGGALFLLLALWTFGRGRSRTTWREAMPAAIAGVLGVFLYNFLFFWGLDLAPSMDGSTVVPVMSPVFTAGYLLLTRQEKASPIRATGLIAGLLGATVFLVGAGVSSEGGTRLLGDVLFFLSAASWAAYTIIGRKVLSGIEPLKATTYATVAGSLLLSIYAVPSYADVDWTGFSTLFWVNAVYLALGPTAIAYLFYYRGVKAVGPASATVMMFLVPVTGMICSAVFLNESFDLVQGIGAVILLLGAIVAVTEGRLPWRRRNAPATAEPAPMSVPTSGAGVR
jgi:drug/metabolite transporter (DMT)-like permease